MENDTKKTPFQKFETFATCLINVKKSELPKELPKPTKRAKNGHITASH